ncbi:MAG: beta-N-acetylglucosaminidase domain-containing protein [Lentisphaeria bacterium]|nr:beta-N-acetylglucosaminidase domain-containing protein [Lentisphaeria bacterium]
MQNHRIIGVVLALLFMNAAYCANSPLDKIVPDYMPGKLEVAITPKPQQADLKDTAFTVGKVFLVKPKNYNAPDALAKQLAVLIGEGQVKVITPEQVGKPAAGDTYIFIGRQLKQAQWKKLVKKFDLQKRLDAIKDKGEDAYVLLSASSAMGKANVVLLSGNSPAGDFWAFSTLRQMLFKKGKTNYLREGAITDFPRFTYRGNKRPREWEWKYKANFSWQNTEHSELFRRHSSPIIFSAYGTGLFATDKEMDVFAEKAQKLYKEGIRQFVVKFDDAGWKLSKPTKEKFGTGDPWNDYFKALHYFLHGMHKRVKAIDSKNKLFFMPRPYWSNSWENREFVSKLLKHGPLPKDIGLSVCGPEVISWTIPTNSLKEWRELYGFTGKAQIYDNFGRGGEYFAFTGRDKDLWKEVDCIFPERGTLITRITTYDYLWNPEAYDEKRALLLAIRELSKGIPEVYKALADYILLYNAQRDPVDFPERKSLLASRAKGNILLKKKYDALMPILAKHKIVLSNRPAKNELWLKATSIVGEYAALNRRLAMEPYMAAHGYKEGRVASTEATIKVDGKLDEAAWQKAAAFPAFSQPGWSGKTIKPVTDYLVKPEEKTETRMLYSKTHFYVGIKFSYTKKPTVANYLKPIWKNRKPGDKANFAWRAPCFEIFLDTSGKRDHYYQIVSNIADIWLPTNCRAYEKGKTGGDWHPDWKFKFTLGEKSGVFEASVPLKDLGKTAPAKGTVWGLQIYRSKIGSFQMFSGVYDMVGGEHGSRQFGRIVFD